MNQLKHNKIRFAIFLFEFLFISSLLSSQLTANVLKDDNSESTLSSSTPFENGIIYSGFEQPVVINETAELFQSDHYSIGNNTYPDYKSTNTSFYLDETHNWIANYYEANISNIMDEREWTTNGGFNASQDIIVPSMMISCSENSFPKYKRGANPNPSNPTNRLSEFDGTGYTYMRLHFATLDFEGSYDFLYIYDKDYVLLDKFTGWFYNLTTPWYKTTKLILTIESDSSSVELTGYNCDRYDLYNREIYTSLNNWTFKSTNNVSPTRFFNKTVNISNKSAIAIGFNGENTGTGQYTYYSNDESAIYQNLSIPRGNVKNAWFSYDYLFMQGLPTNDLYLFLRINNEYIDTIGFRTLNNNQPQTWKTTGYIPLAFWENSSNIFSGNLNNQNLNISFGIRVDYGISYTGFNNSNAHVVYVDNIKLIIQSEVNSTQSDINLTIDGTLTANTGYNYQFGKANISKPISYSTNPIKLLMETNASMLQLDLSSHVYAYHEAESYSMANGIKGKTLKISTTGSIEWSFYHLVYTPPQYTNFQYSILKSSDWNYLEVKDPTGLDVDFDYGKIDDGNITINKSYAYYPGWWYFKAESPNLIDKTNTRLWNRTEWLNYQDISADNSLFYDIGDTISLQTKINMINQESTWANLTVFYPNATEWFTTVSHPDSDGNIQFKNYTMDAWNATAGIYSYRIIWINDLYAGGLNGTFEIRHNLNFRLQYPRDAEFDLISNGFFGDVIPIRILLNNSITGDIVNEAVISYNWSDGIHYINEIGLGIYDGSLDTLDLAGVGVYNVEVNLSRSGYYTLSFILTLNLISDSRLNINAIQNNVEWGYNFSIELRYNAFPNLVGIENAIIKLNVSDSAYNILPGVTAGIYLVNVSTNNLPSTGSYDIEINASHSLYQYQEIRTRIQVLPKQVYLQIFVNQSDCTANKSINAFLGKYLNLSVSVFDNQNNNYVLDGKLTILSGSFEQDLDSTGNLYNTMINTNDLGIGSHYLNILFNKTDYYIHSIVFNINVLPIDVYFKFYANAIDHTLNKSVLAIIEQNLQLAIEVYSSEDNTLIKDGEIKITNNQGFEKIINSITGMYSVNFNSEELGLGPHYLSVVFNKYGYQSSSFTIQIGIEQKVLIPVFYNMDSTIITNPRTGVDVTIYLSDSLINEPIINAKAAYSWIYGEGMLEEIGNGYYRFHIITPLGEGSYTMIISISGLEDYSTSQIQLTIINQPREATLVDYWWVLIPIAVVIVALISVVIKQNVIAPKKQREIDVLKQKTQIFDDITNIRAVLVIQKNSGLLMYKQVISGLDASNEQLFTGFLQAIMMISSRITSDANENRVQNPNTPDSIEFTQQNFNILVMDGKEIRVALILEVQASKELKDMVRKFISEFEGIFSIMLPTWNGDITPFEATSNQLVEEIFKLSLLRFFSINKSTDRYKLEKKLVVPKTITEQVYNIINTLNEERKMFKLKTILTLLPESDRLAAKDVILRFIKNNLLVLTEPEK